MRAESAKHSLTFSASDQQHEGFYAGNHQLNISSLRHFSALVESHEFAIKYVKEGVESYRINKVDYKIAADQYLLLNGHKTGTVEIDSATNVKGICISVANALVSQVVASRRAPDSAYTDVSLSAFFCSNSFLENRYSIHQTNVGVLLASVSNKIVRDGISNEEINEEFFFQIAEAIVEDQVKVFKQLQDIPAVKILAKKDLFRRLQRGKELMDESFCHSIRIKEIAREAAMSEFHFYRLFKSIYSCSPYQYLLNRRLEFAKSLLYQKESISNTAIVTGFSDPCAFSKAFKKKFGFSPGDCTSQKKQVLTVV